MGTTRQGKERGAMQRERQKAGRSTSGEEVGQLLSMVADKSVHWAMVGNRKTSLDVQDKEGSSMRPFREDSE
jgi:hypothetical protein